MEGRRIGDAPIGGGLRSGFNAEGKQAGLLASPVQPALKIVLQGQNETCTLAKPWDEHSWT